MLLQGIGLDEIRAINFALYDSTQLIFNNCKKSEITIAIAWPVVAKHKTRNEIILYGGGIHFSKESLKKDNWVIYGCLVDHNENGSWKVIEKSNYFASISQEHGVLKVTGEKFNEIDVGDLVYILPVHFCLAMDLLKKSISFI